MIKKRYIAIVLSFFIHSPAAHGVLADQAFMSNALPENRHFIEFLNIAVSNFGTPEHFSAFEKAVQHDFNANIHFMSGRYVQSHSEVLKSQKLMRDIYYTILTGQYIPDTQKMLKMSAPIIFHAKDKQAQTYLTFGYRHLEKARILIMRGFNSNRFLYSTKISLYIRAFIDIRQAKKYAIMALVESKVPLVDKDAYQTQTLNEALKVSVPEKIRLYDKIKFALANAIFRKQLPDYPFFLHHADNFGYIYENKKSALTEANEKLDGASPPPGAPIPEINPTPGTNPQPDTNPNPGG